MWLSFQCTKVACHACEESHGEFAVTDLGRGHVAVRTGSAVTSEMSISAARYVRDRNVANQRHGDVRCRSLEGVVVRVIQTLSEPIYLILLPSYVISYSFHRLLLRPVLRAAALPVGKRYLIREYLPTFVRHLSRYLLLYTIYTSSPTVVTGPYFHLPTSITLSQPKW